MSHAWSRALTQARCHFPSGKHAASQVAAALALCATLFWPDFANFAWGNGRAPDTTAVAANTSDPNLMMAALTFGAAITKDGGTTWNWICEDAISGPSSDDSRLVSLSDGRWVMLNQTGLRVASSDGCTWLPVGDFNARNAANSVFVAADDPNDWLVTYQASGTFYGTLTRSLDGGQSFSTMTKTDDGELFYAAWFSVDRKHWLAAASNNQSTNSLFIYRSDDGAATWTKSAVAAAPAAATLPGLAVSAADQNVVLLTAFDVAQSQTVVMHSVDGARTFAFAGSVGGGMRGVTFDPADSNRAWVSGTTQITMSIDGGQTFKLLDKPGGDACVFADAGMVYSCGNLAADGYTVARGSSASAQWQSIFDMNRLQGPFHCAAGTPTYDMCQSQWAQRAGVIGAPVNPSSDTTSPSSAGGKASGGCHCHQGADAGWSMLPVAGAAYGFYQVRRGLRKSRIKAERVV